MTDVRKSTADMKMLGVGGYYFTNPASYSDYLYNSEDQCLGSLSTYEADLLIKAVQSALEQATLEGVKLGLEAAAEWCETSLHTEPMTAAEGVRALNPSVIARGE